MIAGAARSSAWGPDGLDSSAPGDPALIAYTSGTTGSPKGAVLSHGNILANSESVALTWRWQADDRLVHALPIFHGHGLCVALCTSLLCGSSVVLLPRFDADAVLDASAAHRATMFFGVPTMYHRLAASARVDELSRLRLAVSGSAPLAADLHGRIRRDGGTDVLERYGMTETLMTISNPYEGERRPGTVGFPFPGVDVRLDGEEILVRGPDRLRRLLGATGGHGRTSGRGLVPYRGPGRRRGRLREHPGTRQRPHRVRGVQRLPGRGGGRPSDPPVGGRGGGHGDTVGGVG